MYRIADIGAGFLAIMEYPGSGRSVEATLTELAGRGVRQVVSMLEADEAVTLGLAYEAEQVRSRGMEFVSCPVPDMGLPPSRFNFARLSWVLYEQVAAGNSTLVHCRGGVGRSGLMAASVLLHTGLSPARALDEIGLRRGVRLPETPEQELGWEDSSGGGPSGADR